MCICPIMFASPEEWVHIISYRTVRYRTTVHCKHMSLILTQRSLCCANDTAVKNPRVCGALLAVAWNLTISCAVQSRRPSQCLTLRHLNQSERNQLAAAAAAAAAVTTWKGSQTNIKLKLLTQNGNINANTQSWIQDGEQIRSKNYIEILGR